MTACTIATLFQIARDKFELTEEVYCRIQDKRMPMDELKEDNHATSNNDLINNNEMQLNVIKFDLI